MGAGNTTRLVYENNGTFNCPAGVTSVKVKAVANYGAQIAGEGTNMIAIKSDGTAYAWGENNQGGLGDGTIIAKSAPVLVSGGFTWRQVSAARRVAGGINSTGNAFTWGDATSASGNLGLGDVVSRSVPTILLGGLKWKQILVDPATSCGLTQAGQAYCWGDNSSAQIGNGNSGTTPFKYSSPIAVLGGLTFKKLMNAFGSNIGGIAQDGTAYFWGGNSSGTAGNGTALGTSSPVAVVGGYKWRDISGGLGATIGVSVQGDLYIWGSNQYGLWGIGTSGFTNRSSPVLLTGGKKWRRAYCNGDSVLAVDAAGTAWSWGRNDYGQLGLGDTLNRSTPTQVLGFTSPLLVSKAAVMGGNANFSAQMSVIANNGNIYCWGQNGTGGLGNGANVLSASSPTLVTGGFVWKALDEYVILEIPVTTTPGTAYPVIVDAAYASFSGFPLTTSDQLPAPVKIIVEFDS